MDKAIAPQQKRAYVGAIIAVVTGFFAAALIYVMTDDRLRSYVLLMLADSHICH